MSYQIRYAYDCEMNFNNGSKEIPILKEYVKFIYIDRDYEKTIMPVIYVKANLPADIYNEMVSCQGKGSVYLRIYKWKLNCTSTIMKTVDECDFEYFITEDPNAAKELDKENSSSGSAFKTTYIGLVDQKLQQYNVGYFEGIFKDTNVSSLIMKALPNRGRRSTLIQTINNNTDIKEFACPPVSSVGQFLSLLNSNFNFYNRPYTYFIDFDKTYLRANDGSFIDDGSNSLHNIAIDIRNLTDYQAQVTGIVVDESRDAYILYIHAANASIRVDDISSQMVNNVVTVNPEGNITDQATIDTSEITNLEKSLGTTMVIPSIDTNASQYAAALLENQTVNLTIGKSEVDTSIFTPNKKYMLSYFEFNRTYQGIYRPTSIKTMYTRNGAQMLSQVVLDLTKVI